MKLERTQLKNFLRGLTLLTATLALQACSSSFLKYEKEEQLQSNDEFDKVVNIDEQAAAKGTSPETAAKPEATSGKPGAKAKPVKVVAGKKTKKGKRAAVTAATATEEATTAEQPAVPSSTGREPDIEDTEGFQGRRPLVDPTRVGEVVHHDVNYFKVSAGKLRMKVEPFVQVNGRKSYTFAMEIETSSVFSSFYQVNDRVTTLVDFDELIPRVFTLHVKESGQLREARSFFDFDKNTATYWEKKYTKKDGHEEKKDSWEILPYTQNVYSAIFYMRMFKWEVGKEIAFRVSDDKNNLVFRGKCLRRETLSTPAGEFKALVIRPEFTLKGKFRPVGENLIWISDDDRKYILRIESSIKIGTLVSEVTKIEPGK